MFKNKLQKKNYSVFFFFINLKKNYKKQEKSFEDLKKIINTDFYKKKILIEKRLNKYIKSNVLKKNYICKNIKYWKKENLRIHLLFKEYLYGFYEEDAFCVYLIFLGHYFFKPVKYDFFLTNSMKIKVFLWTSPVTVRKDEPPIIELRTLTKRINDLESIKRKFFLWKSLKKCRRLPRLYYKSKYYMSSFIFF